MNGVLQGAAADLEGTGGEDEGAGFLAEVFFGGEDQDLAIELGEGCSWSRCAKSVKVQMNSYCRWNA